MKTVLLILILVVIIATSFSINYYLNWKWEEKIKAFLRPGVEIRVYDLQSEVEEEYKLVHCYKILAVKGDKVRVLTNINNHKKDVDISKLVSFYDKVEFWEDSKLLGTFKEKILDDYDCSR